MSADHPASTNLDLVADRETPVVTLPKRCQSVYAGLQCAFVLAHDHPHGNEDSGVYVTWGRMASPQQPTVLVPCARCGENWLDHDHTEGRPEDVIC